MTETGKSLVATDYVERLQQALVAVTRLLNQRATLGTIASRCGYKLPQASWALLEYLEERGAMRVSDVATCHGVDISTITPRIKALEKAALVTRATATEDGRVSIIQISEGGRLALASVQTAQRSIIVEALAGSSIPVSDISIASDLLECLSAKLEAIKSPERHDAELVSVR